MRTVYKGAQGVRAMTVYDEILSHLRKCAALMSDPVIIRHEPSTVADAFVSAFHKIEQLQGLLPIQDEKTCGCTRPMDASIINSGIKQLVSLTLAKQLEPLRKPFPRIIAQDFKSFKAAPHAETDENLVEREIKETNSIAALVLLYYYLLWHILLIVINKKYLTQEAENIEDVVNIIAQLPKASELLEFKHIGLSFEHAAALPDDSRAHTITALTAAHSLKGLMTNDFYTPGYVPARPNARNDPGAWMDRKTSLVPLYRRVIEKIIGDGNGNGVGRMQDINTTWQVAHTLQRLLDDIKDDYVVKQLQLQAGVLSTFHLNEATQKWEDAYKPHQIECRTAAPENKLAAFEFRLHRVITNLPYSTNAETCQRKAVPLSIYDYNNTPLMIDISKSAVQLKALITGIVDTAFPERVPKLLSHLLLQFTAVDPAIEVTLSDADLQDVLFRHATFAHYIAETPNAFREQNGTIELTALNEITRITVDHIPAYYVGSGPINLESTNHTYLACPSIIVNPEDASVIARVQHIVEEIDVSTTRTPLAGTIHQIISPLLRNSLVAKYGIKAMILLLERSKNIQKLTPITAYEYPTPSTNGTQINPLFQTITGAPATRNISRTDMLAILKKEQAAYQAYVDKFTSKHFRLMSGVSWPVRYTSPAGTVNPAVDTTNHASFQFLRFIPTKILGTTREIVERLDLIATAAGHVRT